jgi:glycosyltransferase A (GT-A) superfamily protein (DUF2064 family)
MHIPEARYGEIPVDCRQMVDVNKIKLREWLQLFLCVRQKGTEKLGIRLQTAPLIFSHIPEDGDQG